MNLNIALFFLLRHNLVYGICRLFPGSELIANRFPMPPDIIRGHAAITRGMLTLRRSSPSTRPGLGRCSWPASHARRRAARAPLQTWSRPGSAGRSPRSCGPSGAEASLRWAQVVRCDPAVSRQAPPCTGSAQGRQRIGSQGVWATEKILRCQLQN